MSALARVAKGGRTGEFLLATVHFVLNVKPAQRHERKVRPQTPIHLRAGHGKGRNAGMPTLFD